MLLLLPAILVLPICWHFVFPTAVWSRPSHWFIVDSSFSDLGIFLFLSRTMVSLVEIAK